MACNPPSLSRLTVTSGAGCAGAGAAGDCCGAGGPAAAAALRGALTRVGCVSRRLSSIGQDASEKCRELALTTLLLVVLRAPPSVLALLPYVLPVLRDDRVLTLGL